MTWPTRVKLASLVVGTVVLQTTLFPDLRLFGVAPDLVLVGAIAVAYRVGPERGAIYGFAAGLAIDLFLQTPLGISALSFAIVGYGIGILQTGLSHPPRFVAAMVGGAGGLAGGLIFVAIAALAGEDQVIALRSLWVLGLAALYDALLAVPMFRVARGLVASRDVVETPAVRGARSP